MGFKLGYSTLRWKNPDLERALDELIYGLRIKHTQDCFGETIYATGIAWT